MTWRPDGEVMEQADLVIGYLVPANDVERVRILVRAVAAEARVETLDECAEIVEEQRARAVEMATHLRAELGHDLHATGLTEAEAQDYVAEVLSVIAHTMRERRDEG